VLTDVENLTLLLRSSSWSKDAEAGLDEWVAREAQILGKWNRRGDQTHEQLRHARISLESRVPHWLRVRERGGEAR
jgi:hypothetical protein